MNDNEVTVDAIKSTPMNRVLVFVLVALATYVIGSVVYNIGQDNGIKSERAVADQEIADLEARTYTSRMVVVSVSGSNFNDYSILGGQNGEEIAVSNYLLRELGYEGKTLIGNYYQFTQYRNGYVVDISPSKSSDPEWCPGSPYC